MENKTENKKGMDINVWLPILNDLNIDPSKHYEVLDYISRHSYKLNRKLFNLLFCVRETVNSSVENIN